MPYRVESCDQSGLQEFLNANEEEGWKLVQVWHTPIPPNTAGYRDTGVILHKKPERKGGQVWSV